MKLYPACLKLKNVCCLVIGGGEVALRKVKSLVECQAKITVVSPQLCPGLEVLKKKKSFFYWDSIYKKQFLKDAFLVIAATNDLKTNTRIAQEATRLGKLVNVVDQPGLCNFYIPAVIRKEPFLLCISTQGVFPGLAKKLRMEFSQSLNQYQKIIDVLSSLRTQIKKIFKQPKTRSRLIKKLLKPEAIRLIKAKKIKNLEDFKRYFSKQK